MARKKLPLYTLKSKERARLFAKGATKQSKGEVTYFVRPFKKGFGIFAIRNKK